MTKNQLYVDALGDRKDGARAVEVTAVFEDSAILVRHLHDPNGGQVSRVTWGLLAVGLTTAAASLIVALAGQGGLGSLGLALGTATLLYALARRGSESRSPHFVLGTSEQADLEVLHPAAGEGDLPLVRAAGGRFELVLSPTMSGMATLGVHRYALADYASCMGSSPLPDHAGAFSMPIADGARCEIQLGAHTFFINSVTAAAAMTSSFWSRVSWSNQLFTSLSFAGHVALLLVVFAVPPNAKAFSNDLFSHNNKFVRYLTKPPVDDELPPTFGKGKLTPAQSGKHRGKAGAAGDKKAPKRKRRLAVKGNDANAPKAIPRKVLLEQVRNSGILGQLMNRENRRVASLFSKADVFSGDTKAAFGKLRDDGLISEAYGTGGFAVRGTGRGGGDGISDGAGNGLKRIRGIGLGLPDGKGVYAPGVKLTGTQPKRIPKPKIGPITTVGCLDKAIVRRLIRRRIKQVKHCYVKGLQSDGELKGRVVVKFAIGGTGRVVTSGIESSTLQHPPTETCVAKTMRRILFPAIKCGLVTVKYPFVFHPTGR